MHTVCRSVLDNYLVFENHEMPQKEGKAIVEEFFLSCAMSESLIPSACSRSSLVWICLMTKGL